MLNVWIVNRSLGKITGGRAMKISQNNSLYENSNNSYIPVRGDLSTRYYSLKTKGHPTCPLTLSVLRSNLLQSKMYRRVEPYEPLRKDSFVSFDRLRTNGLNRFRSLLFSFLCAFLFIFPLLKAETEVKLRLIGTENVRDVKSGKVMPTAYVGENFKIEAVVSGGGRNIGDIQINGLDRLNVTGRNQSTSISVINSSFSSENTFIYDVVSNEEGDFELGPATVEQNGKTIESVPRKLNFKVIQKKDGTVVRGGKSRTQNAQDNEYEVFCKLEIDKEKVFVGEPVLLKVNIYNRGKILQFGLEPPKFPGFLTKEIPEVLKRTEQINNKVYSVLEKRFHLLPLEEGVKQISPVNVDFNIPVVRKRKNPGFLGKSFFDDDFFAGFMGQTVETKRANSNSLQIKVDPLPEHKGFVDGVGKFDTFKLDVDKKDAIINEPILLSVEVAGKGNLDQVVAPRLKFPENFKTYESKTDLKEDLNKDYIGGKKRFEFVLQVGKVGECKIPEQQFTYFDVDSKTYKTLKSAPINLMINQPPEGQGAQTFAPFSQDDDKPSEPEKVSYKQDIHFIEEDISSITKKERKTVPIWLFLILILMPFLYYFKNKFVPLGIWFSNKFLHRYKARKSLSKFKKDLDIIIKKENLSELYPFFINYFAAKFGVEASSVTEDWIENKLKKAKWQEARVSDFLNHLNKCASLTFAVGAKIDLDYKKMLEKSQYWFFMLESDSSK